MIHKKLLEIDKDFKTTVILRDNSFKDDVDKTNAIKKLEQVGINEIRSIWIIWNSRHYLEY